MTIPQPVTFTPPAPLTFNFTPWRVLDPTNIPATRFVYGDFFAAGYLSVTFAAPKTGKSLLALAEAIDAATGRGFLTGKTAAPIKVLYYNAEDDLAVLQARAVAMLQHWGIPQAEIVGRLFLVSGVAHETPIVLIEGKDGKVNEPVFKALEDLLRQENITLAVFDPLQDLSHGPEDNDVFRALGGRIRALASCVGSAIGLVHHTRKPSPGITPTIDDGRGGSALRGAARFNRLLLPMTEAEGAQSGVDDFRRFFRIGEAESNLAPPSSTRNRWFEKLGVLIGNGENVATIRPWTWPDHFAGVTVNDACKVRAAIAARDPAPRADMQAKDWAGKVIAETLHLDLAKASDKARAKVLLAKWIETDVLRTESRACGNKGKVANFVVAGENNPAIQE